jgi:hypothetical protein
MHAYSIYIRRFDTHNQGHSVAVNYRAHLSFPDPLRQDPAHGLPCHETPPPFRTHAETFRIAEKIRAYTKDPKLRNKNKYAEYGNWLLHEMSRYGINESSCLFLLQHFDIIWDVLPDMMHICDGVWERWLIPLFKGELIERNQKPKRPSPVHLDNTPYTPAEMHLRMAIYDTNLALWQSVTEVK